MFSILICESFHNFRNFKIYITAKTTYSGTFLILLATGLLFALHFQGFIFKSTRYSTLPYFNRVSGNKFVK